MHYLRQYLLLPCILLGLALLGVSLSGVSVAAEAANVAPKGNTPKNLEVLEDLSQPPKTLDETLVEPQVTIVKKGTDIVEEYRINGELYMMKVTPSHGVPYYLQKQDQEGGWSRLDGPSPPLVIPKWVIFRF